MSAYVATTGTISFRLDYAYHGQRRTLTLGKYGIISLAQAREMVLFAKKLLADDIDPVSNKKQQAIRQDDTFGYWCERYIRLAEFSESTRKLRLRTYIHNMRGDFANVNMADISETQIRQFCAKIKERGAPYVAVFVRDLFSHVFKFAQNQGVDYGNPAENIKKHTIAKFKPRERALSETELILFFRYLAKSELSIQTKKALELLLLTLCRKTEVAEAKWCEINFETKVWTIPAERMKAKRPHNVYVSAQALSILEYLKVFAGQSPFVFLGRKNENQPLYSVSINRAIKQVYYKTSVVFNQSRCGF